jgi:uncharacterized protein (TIGR03435 family)
MTKWLNHHLLILAACGCALAQSGPKLEFEVASVKVAPPPQFPPVVASGCHGGPGTSDPGLFTCTLTLMNFIARAYDLRSFQISAPDWTQHQPAFEIKATVPPGTTAEQCNVMLQNLLIDRFKLSVHREPKELSRFELVVAEGGVKLKEATDDAAEPAPPLPPQVPSVADRGMPPGFRKIVTGKDGYPVEGRPGWQFTNGRARYYEPRGTMQGIATFLTTQMEKPVVDATGLKGKYQISMYYVTDTGVPPAMAQLMAQARAQARANAGLAPGEQDSTPEVRPSGPTLPQALRDQLGLRLEAKKGPVDMLVVDRIEKLPTDN